MGSKVTFTSASAVCLFAFAVGSTGACMGLVSLSDRPCPCAADFVCCSSTDTCVPLSHQEGCSADEASTGDAAQAADDGRFENLEDVGPAPRDVPADADQDADAAEGRLPDASPADAPPPSDGPFQPIVCADAGVHHDGAWFSMAAGPLSPRVGPLFVWAGDDRGKGQLVVWGGRSLANKTLGDGALYDPQADRWSPMNSVGAPPATGNPGAVWTGTRVLVRGGTTALPTDPVRAYDPAANVWSAGGPPPVALYGTLLAWTGNEMLLYSGGVGATYAPDTGQWGTMNTAGAPCAQRGSAVWTGSVWIVWGGQSCSSSLTYVRDGAAYDPAANAWTALPLGGAPTARADHVAVWTGSEMIIWGGVDASGAALADGGAYDPVARTWRPITGGADSVASIGCTAVGLPLRMLLWGGTEANGTQAPQGAEFDACSGAWWLLPSAGQPSLRAENSAAWTGLEMLVWGGWESPSQTVATGGRYVP